MYRVRDNVYLDVLIGGKSYPIEVTGFVSLKIVSSLDTFVPMLEFVLVDSINFFTEKITLADGLLIRVNLGSSPKEFDTMLFRVHKYKDVKTNGASHYTITAYLDVPAYFLATSNVPIQGTSTSVLQTIAGYAGMSFDGDSTSDDQVWLPHNARYCAWAAEVVKHAYAGDSSLMRLGVNPLKKMIYRDVMKIDVSGTLPVFVNTDHNVGKNIFQMLDQQTISKGGHNNNLGGGYGHLLVTQGATAEMQTTRSTVGFKRFSPYLEVGKEVKGLVQNAAGSPGVQRVQFAPIDCGNTHDNYWSAEYQNKRLSRLFSVGARWYTDAQTKVDLLDAVKYLPKYAPGAVDAANKEQVQGIYIVTAKSIKLQMGNYFESFEGFTNGSATDPSGTNSQE
jgi:hypothetical protein